MNESQRNQDREEQVRRTASARRGLVAVGAVGALGAALGIGISQTIASTNHATADNSGIARQNTQQPTVREGDDGESSDDDGQRQPALPQQQSTQGGGQLAAPGNGSPPQGSSGGS